MNLEEPNEIDVPKMKSEPEIDDLEELERELGLEFEGKDEQNHNTNAEVEPEEKSNYPPDPKAAGPKVAKSGEYSRTVTAKPLKHHNEENLRLHRNINSGVKLLVCKICKYRTWKKSNMKMHKRTHAAGSRQSYVGSSNANKWMETFTGKRNLNHNVNFSRPPSVLLKENSFKCDECDFEANHKWDLLEHKTTHSREAPCEFEGSDPNWEPKTFRSEKTKSKVFSCDVCDYRSRVMGELMKHKKLHTHYMPFFTCVTCNAKFKRKCHLMNHKRIHGEQKPFKCKYCNISFKVKISLKRHEVIHEKFLCDLCDYRTGLFSNLRAHKALHMGQTPSADDACNSAFKGPRMSRDRPTYTCEECPFKTGRKNELIIHMVTHTGEKPFKCAECDYGTVYKQNLKKHLQKRREDGFCTKREWQTHHCETCEYSTRNKQDLIMHMVTHTGEKPFKCTDCEFGTVYEFSLNIHRRKKHRGTSTKDRQSKGAEADGSTKPAMDKEMDQVTEMHPIGKGMASTMPNEMESSPPLEPGKDEHEKAVESTKMEVAGREEHVDANQADHIEPSGSPRKDGEPTSAPAYDDLLDSDGESFHETSRFKRIMRRLDTTSLLWTGVRRRTEAKPFTCNQCDYRSRWEFNLWKHLETHKEEKPYKCDQCDFRTGSLKGLKAHMKIRGHGSYERGIQDSLARRSAELDENMEHRDEYDDEYQRYKSAHDTITAGEKRYETIASYKTDHLTNPLPDQPISPSTDHCGPGNIEMELEMTPAEHEADQITLQAGTAHDKLVERFSRIYRSSEAAHKEAYRATEPVQTEKEPVISGPTPKKHFKCYECDFACNSIFMLNGHMKVHKLNITKASIKLPVKHRSGTKRFGCPYCKYRSQWSNNVISHMRTHTGERPYRCRICDTRFSQNATLSKHLTTHPEMTENPDKCLNGDFEPNHLNSLKAHLGELQFKCYTCGYQTAYKGHLMRHQRIHTGEKPYMCDQCDFCSGYLHALRKHKQRRHHKNLPPIRRQKRQQSRMKVNDVPEHSVGEDVEGPAESLHEKNEPRAAYDAKTDRLIVPVDEQSNGTSKQTTKTPDHSKTGNYDFVDSDDDIVVESCGTGTSRHIESARNDQLITSSTDEDDHLANPEVDEIGQLTKRFREEVDQLIGSIQGQVEHSSKPSKVKHDRNNKPTVRMTAQGPRRLKQEKSYAREHSNAYPCVNPCESPSQTSDPVQDETDTKPTLCELLDNSYDEEISQGVEVSVKPDPDNSKQFVKPEEESSKFANSVYDEAAPIKLEPEEKNHFSNSSPVEYSLTSETDHAEFDQAALPPFSEEPIMGSENRLQDPQYVVSNGVGKLIKCDLCDSQSDGRFLLEIHKKIHKRTTTIKPRPRENPTKGGSGIKPFAWDQCDYRSRWRANLTKRLIVHTGERPFECDLCGFQTAQQQSLSNHRRTHMGERHSHWKRSINKRKTDGASQSITADEDVESALRNNSTSGPVDDEMESDIEPTREELDQFIKPIHDEMDQFVRVVTDLTDPAMKPDDKKDLSTVITDESVTPAYETSVYPTCPVCLKSERKMFKFRCEKCRYFWKNILKKGLGPPDCPGHSSESEGLDCPGCRWGRYLIASKEWERTQSVTIRAS